MMKYPDMRSEAKLLIIKIGTNPQLKRLVRSAIALGLSSGISLPASAQITTGGDNTKVNPNAGNANIIDIKDGTPSSSGANLFHSFGTFNLTSAQTANFVQPNGAVQNIFGRVTGGQPSAIDGKIQVSGGNANLYLMNPAGIVFGKNASLDVNGAFTATTAKAIGFGNGNWFNALGANNYNNLAGNPEGFAFTNTPAGSIVSASNLNNVQSGKNITLVGGTVISTGNIATKGGKISIATVEGGKYVQIQSEGNILRLNLPASADNITSDAKAFTAVSLPNLLTANQTIKDLTATGVTVDSKTGVVTLVGDTRSIATGDIVTKTLSTAGDPNGGNVSLNTQAGNIIIDNIDTSSQNFATGGKGGNVTVNAGGLFRVTGFVGSATNVSPVTDRQGNKINNSGVSIFTGGNIDGNLPESSFQGGKINITYSGNVFVVGGETKIDPDPKSTNISVILNEPFSFPDGASGTRGAIVSRNSNGNLRVVFTDKGFIDQDGGIAGGFKIEGTGSSGQGVNPDSQASRQKSKGNCALGSSPVATNPKSASTRSADKASSSSKDGCQLDGGDSGKVLQIKQ